MYFFCLLRVHSAAGAAEDAELVQNFRFVSIRAQKADAKFLQDIKKDYGLNDTQAQEMLAKVKTIVTTDACPPEFDKAKIDLIKKFCEATKNNPGWAGQNVKTPK